MVELEKVNGFPAIVRDKLDIINYIKDLIDRSNSKLIVINSIDDKVMSEVYLALRSMQNVECYRANELRDFEVRNILANADIGITNVDFAIAETGSIVMINDNDVERLVTSLPKIHVAVVDQDKILESFVDVAEIIANAQRDRSCVVSIITGPSRTADIEHELVLGVHGPLELHVLIMGDKEDARV